jgi:hypothetical protein
MNSQSIMEETGGRCVAYLDTSTSRLLGFNTSENCGEIITRGCTISRLRPRSLYSITRERLCGDIISMSVSGIGTRN